MISLMTTHPWDDLSRFKWRESEKAHVEKVKLNIFPDERKKKKNSYNVPIFFVAQDKKYKKEELKKQYFLWNCVAGMQVKKQGTKRWQEQQRKGDFEKRKNQHKN